MIDQRLDSPETVEVEADGETLAAIDRALEERDLAGQFPSPTFASGFRIGVPSTIHRLRVSEAIPSA